jgi:RNA polymerase sigma factor (sigma-70 family)
VAAGQLVNVLHCIRRAALLRDLQAMSDGQLLESFLQTHHDAAFEALVRRHGPMVLGVCQRLLVNTADAEDAFQATFLVLVRRAASVVPRELLGHWLYGVAYRTALKARALMLRRRSRERQVDNMPDRPVAAPEIWDDLQPLLDRELDALPEVYRVAVVSCELAGKSKKEVARQLGVPEGTVSSRLARGRRLLRDRLARHGLKTSSAAMAGLLAQSPVLANVPKPLVASTVHAAALVAANTAAQAVAISARVTLLMEGVLKSMLLAKLRAPAFLLLSLALVGTALGLATVGGSTAPQVRAQPPALAAPLVQTAGDQKETKPLQPPLDRPDLAAQKALEAADKMTDDRLKIFVLADIAVAQTLAGDETAGKKTLQKAFALAEKLKEKTPIYCRVLNKLAEAQAAVGQRTAANLTIKKSTDAAKSIGAPNHYVPLHGIAMAQVACGDVEGAWKTWEDNQLDGVFGGNGGQLKSLITVAKIKAGDIKGARQTLDEIAMGAASPGKQEAQVALVEALLKSGDKKAAEEVLDQALAEAATLLEVFESLPAAGGVTFCRSEALVRLAIAQDKVGAKGGAAKSLEQALATIRDFQPATGHAAMNKTCALVEVAEAQSELGDKAAAQKTVQLALAAAKGTDKESRHWALRWVARAQLKARDWDGAIKTLEPLTWEKADLFEDLALAMTLAGEPSRALELTADTYLPVVRARAFLGVARGLAQLKAKGKP